MQELLKEIVEGIRAKFRIEHEIRDNCIFIKAQKADYLNIAQYLESCGFKRLLTVSAIDWKDENEFEAYFIVHNPEEGVYTKVSTRIPRDMPVVKSLSPIWENSLMHERETWELFGITFEGNNLLKPLFLEKWEGPPPFRKDFDWREYVENVWGI